MAHVLLDCPGSTFADRYTEYVPIINKSVYNRDRLGIGISKSVRLSEQEEDAVPGACCRP